MKTLNLNGSLFFIMGYNARVYEPLRDLSALLSSYRKLTRGANIRKPAASNGL
jgi:hypothetical protein